MVTGATKGLVAVLMIVWTTAAGGAEKPNVLMIAVDDLNDWVGCMGGHPQVKTPNLDRLAARGTLMANAHCQAPMCNPSRASLMTGLRPSTTGIYALEPWFREVPTLADAVTLPQYFAAHGYLTLATGKVYHDGHPPPPGRQPGTEFGVWGPHGTHGPFPPRKLVENTDPLWLIDWGLFPQHDEEQDDWKVTSWAIEQLRNMGGDRPFFLSVGLRKPHLPCYATRRWFDLYPAEELIMPPVRPDDRADVPRFAWCLHWRLPEPRLAWLTAHQQWVPLVRSYLACISFMDSQVGRLLDSLAETGLADRTIVVLWSDNGWHAGEKGITGKTSLWERSARVPLIFAGPGITVGGRCLQPAELLDIYPTLIELCGLPTREGLEGRSLVPLLKDPAAARDQPAITTHGPGNHAVRDLRWRYIRYADGSEELYDLRNDPHEWTNLAADPSMAEIKARLARWLPAINAPPVPGSKTRLVEIRDGTIYWEGEPLSPDSRPQ